MVSVESQKDFHARRKHHHYARTTTTTVSSTTKSPVSTTTVTVVEQVEDNQIPEVTRWPTTEPTETWEITTTASSTTMSTTPSTTTTTTTPPRMCYLYLVLIYLVQTVIEPSFVSILDPLSNYTSPLSR